MSNIKRLVKKSNNIVEQFLRSHVLFNDTNQDDIKEILSIHSDCVYNGSLYRSFVFSKDNFTDVNNEEEIRNSIQITNQYNSCSNSINAVRDFANSISSDTQNPLVVIIEFQGTGLDINLLINKCYMYNIIDDDLYDALLINMSENEIVSIVSNDYDIVETY